MIKSKDVLRKIKETLTIDHTRNKMAMNSYIQCPNCKFYGISYDVSLHATSVICPKCGSVIKDPATYGLVGSGMAKTERDME